MQAFEIVKYLITAGLVVAISKIAKRDDFLGALIASLPWVTVLAMCWMYAEYGKEERVEKIASHAWWTFWLVLPTMPMFLILPVLLKKTKLGFPLSLGICALVTYALYALTLALLKKWGVS